MIKDRLHPSVKFGLLAANAGLAFSAACGTVRPSTTETQAYTTPIPSSHTAPPPTETPIPEFTPTPNFLEIDQQNQRLLEQALGGQELTLPKANITSLWQFPWPAEEGEPQVSYIALVWGKDYPPGVITSAGCLRKFYIENDALGEAVVALPLTAFRVWELESAPRVSELMVNISNYTSLADAKSVTIQDPANPGATFEIPCEETKELDRLQETLSEVDWSSLPGEAGEISGKGIGEFVSGFARGIAEALSTAEP